MIAVQGHRAHTHCMISVDVHTKQERPGIGIFRPGVLLIAATTVVLVAMVAGVGDGRGSISPDWRLGLMFGVGALLAASMQTFLHQWIDGERSKQELLTKIGRDQFRAEELMAILADDTAGDVDVQSTRPTD